MNLETLFIIRDEIEDSKKNIRDAAANQDLDDLIDATSCLSRAFELLLKELLRETP